MNGTVKLSPYANFGPTPGFQRLGLKKQIPLKGPPGTAPVPEV